MARIRIAYSIKRQSGRSVADREKRRERRDEALVHPKGLGRRAARVREREEFKSNFDVGKSGQCREGTDGSLRSFDRELKARSRQFSDATSIVTMGGDGLLSFSLSLFPPFSLFLWNLWHEPRVSLCHPEPPPPPPPPALSLSPASVFFPRAYIRLSFFFNPLSLHSREALSRTIFSCLLRPVR